jgi:hypothetical protein
MERTGIDAAQSERQSEEVAGEFMESAGRAELLQTGVDCGNETVLSAPGDRALSKAVGWPHDTLAHLPTILP